MRNVAAALAAWHGAAAQPGAAQQRAAPRPGMRGAARQGRVAAAAVGGPAHQGIHDVLEQKPMSKGVALQKAQVIWPEGGEETVRHPVELPSTGVNRGSKP